MRNLLLAAAVSLAAPALAQDMPPPGHQTVQVGSGTYRVDSGHTQVLFTVMHMFTREYTGQFVQPTGSLKIDVGHEENDHVEIVFPIDTVSTTVAALDAHLKKPEFFDAAKFPDGRFVSTKVSITGTSATIAGNLTLKGVTKPVILAVHFVGAGNNPMTKKVNVGFRATTTIKRGDFGISYGIPLVSDEVKLVINAAFEAE